MLSKYFTAITLSSFVMRSTGLPTKLMVSCINTSKSSSEVIAYTRQEGLVSIPGALTATEALTAHRAGADYVKLFPAAMLGPAYLKALRSPLNHIRFLAVGGVDEKNMAAFLQAGAAGVGVGGCLVKQQWIQEGRFAELTALAKEFCQAIQ